MPRPRVTFSRNGTTSSGPSGPPKETSRSASYEPRGPVTVTGRSSQRIRCAHAPPGAIASPRAAPLRRPAAAPRRVPVQCDRVRGAAPDVDARAGRGAALSRCGASLRRSPAACRRPAPWPTRSFGPFVRPRTSTATASTACSPLVVAAHVVFLLAFVAARARRRPGVDLLFVVLRSRRGTRSRTSASLARARWAYLLAGEPQDAAHGVRLRVRARRGRLRRRPAGGDGARGLGRRLGCDRPRASCCSSSGTRAARAATRSTEPPAGGAAHRGAGPALRYAGVLAGHRRLLLPRRRCSARSRSSPSPSPPSTACAAGPVCCSASTRSRSGISGIVLGALHLTRAAAAPVPLGAAPGRRRRSPFPFIGSPLAPRRPVPARRPGRLAGAHQRVRARRAARAQRG